MPPFAEPSYPRSVATRTPRRRAPVADTPPEPAVQPDGRAADAPDAPDKNGKSGKNGKNGQATAKVGRNGASTAAGRDAARARTAARRDPDGGHGEIHDQLIAAVEETARLLEADGAMVYLLDPDTGHLRFAHDAGIKSAPQP